MKVKFNKKTMMFEVIDSGWFDVVIDHFPTRKEANAFKKRLIETGSFVS